MFQNNFLVIIAFFKIFTNAANVSYTLTIQNSNSFNGPIHFGIGMVCLLI
jgi:hypothetical protein